jgi:hypothetical protein
MKVYVVLESTRHCEHEYCGVYSTLELAEKRIKDIKEMSTRELKLYVQEDDLDYMK